MELIIDSLSRGHCCKKPLCFSYRITYNVVVCSPALRVECAVRRCVWSVQCVVWSCVECGVWSVELCVECGVCKVQFSTELLASHMMHLCSSAAMTSYVDNELGGKTIQCNAVLYGAVYYYVVQCSTVQCS